MPVALAPGRRLRSRLSVHHRPLTAAQLRRRRFRLLRRGLLGTAAVAVLAPVLAFGVGYLLFPVPDPYEALDDKAVLVSYGDGSPLTRLTSEGGGRVTVPIEQVPMHVRHAVLAAEDHSFQSDPGFDPTGILRTAWHQLRNSDDDGDADATIAQQLVAKAMVGDEQSLWRKYEEVVLAVKISQGRDEDDVLADYLNTSYFGRGAYGIGSAARAYFGKDVQDLAPAEGALLAGLIRSPSRWDPAVNPERAVQRWNSVLDGMLAQGRLTPAERAAARFPATLPRRSPADGVPTDHRGHIVTAVRAELAELGFTEHELLQEGVRITTSIDPHRQRLAVDAAHAALDGQPIDLRSAVVAIDPRTGGVLAYYGGDNGLDRDYAQLRNRAGSTFMPFVVLAGLLQEQPVGLGEVVDGAAVPGPRNAERAACDECDLKQAMTESDDAVLHALATRIGPGSVAAAAHAAGVTAPLDTPTAALGDEEVSTLGLASAYATIAAGGVWRPPHLVASVVAADGEVLYQAATEGERRFPQRVARNVVEAMLGVAWHDGLALPGERPVATTTGTAESGFEGENNDAWTSGFTPSLASAVWMGTDMNSPIRTAHGTPIKGSSLPGDVWQDFMSAALEDASVEHFPPFLPIGEPPSPPGPGEEPASPPPHAPPAAGVSPHAPPPAVPDGVVANPDPVELGSGPDEPDTHPDDADDHEEAPEDCPIVPCG
jgi:membrane peptidoglycan carboxypeptidase